MSRRRDDLSTTDRIIYGLSVVALAICILAVFTAAMIARAWWAAGVFLSGEQMKTGESVAILIIGIACLYFLYRML